MFCIETVEQANDVYNYSQTGVGRLEKKNQLSGYFAFSFFIFKGTEAMKFSFIKDKSNSYGDDNISLLLQVYTLVITIY